MRNLPGWNRLCMNSMKNSYASGENGISPLQKHSDILNASTVLR